MQFLPGTWATYGADGNGDGVRDPQQIDDAALASAGHLCVGDRDTATGRGWWSGVLASKRLARLRERGMERRRPVRHQLTPPRRARPPGQRPGTAVRGQ